MKKVLLLVGAIGAFIVGYGAATSFAAYPSGGMYGRSEHRGYFTNTHDTEGTAVLRKLYNGEAIRPDVVDAGSFISFIKYTKLDIDNNGSGTAQDKTGAAFIIHTMLNTPAASRSRPPTAAQITEWERRIRYLDAHDKISWRTNYSYTVNSYYQGTDGGGSDPNDDAFYDENGTMPSIVFRNMSNTVVYVLKWECGNPVGTHQTALPPTPEFNMWGGTTLNVNGGPTVYSANVAPGDTVRFNHYLEEVNNTNSTSPDTISWRVYQGSTIRFNGNAGVFAAGQRKDNVQQETYVVPANAVPGSQICRNIWYTPDTHLGGSQHATERCVTVVYNFTLTPIINISVNGGAPVGSGATAETGDTITFTYQVRNSGSTNSQSASCDVYGITETGPYSVPNPIDSASRGGSFTPPALGCPRVFTGGTTVTLGSDSVTGAATNRTYCRSFFLNPVSYGGGRQGNEGCIRVVGKPTMKVFGGDVMAGGGLETAPATCTANSNAQILTWNRRTDDNYAGSGAQYAITALNRIGDFASGQNAGSSAPAPSALSFANTTANVTAGTFGGSFGSAPCIKNYWSARPASGGGSANVGGMSTGRYVINGNTTLGGTLASGQRVALYVDGDVHINSNISFPASWTTGSLPSFMLVATGNIYVDRNVTQLTGNFVAQGNGTTGGIIYTCATGYSPLALPSLYATCANKLTVTGSFTANRVELLRVNGSLRANTSSDASGTPHVAEEFNYSPVSWMGQPPIIGSATQYDAITSLPPIL